MTTLEEVSVNLRSVIQSCKGGIPIDRLERDYKALLGNYIPFRDLGFNNLEAFLRSIPDVIKISVSRDGQVTVEAKADSSTAHIASLISRQKPSKTVGRGIRRSNFSNRRGSFTSKYSSRGRSSYVSYSTNRPSGRPYKPDAKISTVNHSKTSPNFKIKIDNSNPIPTRQVNYSNTSTAAPVVENTTTKSKTVRNARGFEIAPRFLKEAKKQQQSSANSAVPYNDSFIPTKTSATPPRTPTPPSQYMFPAPTIPASREIYPPRSLSSKEKLSSAAVPSSLSFQSLPEGNGYCKSPRPLRPRLAAVKASQQLDSVKSAKEYIETYARMNNLLVNYSTKPIGQKTKNKGFVSILNLGENKYLSYPDVALTEEGAEEIAAANAVEKIKESQVLPETPISNAEEIQKLLNQIEEIVCDKPSGMFINGLQQEYEHLHNMQLPSCWLELLQQSSVVDIEEIGVSYGKVPDGANFIVRPAKGMSSGSTTPSESSGKMYPELQVSEYDEAAIGEDLVNNSHPKIPPLAIPDGNEWGVYVTDTSKQLVAARLIDNDSDFLDLSRRMSIFYDSTILPVHEVFEKHLYTIIGGRIEGELVMHRVLVNKILDSEWVECYYVDEGITENVRKTDLQKLDDQFLSLPYQIIYFTFDGLEDYEPFIQQEHLKYLNNRTFIAVVKWCGSPYEDFLPDDPGIHKIIYSVVLYDTSGVEDEIVNDDIKRAVEKSLSCSLPKLKAPSQGYLTHVTSTGQIYLRILHPENSWLEQELEKLSPNFEQAASQSSSSIPTGKICVAKYLSDGKWYRVVVPEHPACSQGPDKIEVIFVDYGHPGIVNKSDVVELLPFSELLSKLDYQAIKCELYNALPSPTSKWTVAAIAKLIEFVPSSEELIVRVMEEGQAGILPKVNLHKRIYEDGDSWFLSINENLASKRELFLDLSAISSIETPNISSNLSLNRRPSHLLSKESYVPSITSPIENTISLRNLDIASPENINWMLTPDNIKSPEEEDLTPSPLSPPQVPDKREFDVFVTMAATPGNFTVQALKTATEMNDLMRQMHQFYSIEENLIEMDPSLLQKNAFYAALHSDNEWYRVRLVSSSGILMAYYVDFGDFNEVSLQKLQTLYKQFRVLPCQAIKASLAGVKPIKIDWDPVDCVKFKEMVTEKRFVALVQRKFLDDEDDPYSAKLELTLIDTSTSKDIYIHELLIKNSMALETAI